MIKRSGFTFVEILLTLLILSITVVPMMQLFSTAMEQLGTVDDIRTALDLGREEVEKVKNLALTEEQIKQMGMAVSPPIMLNKTIWFAARVVDPTATPLQLTVFVFRDSLDSRPILVLVTAISKS